jgi:hypothetical protein
MNSPNVPYGPTIKVQSGDTYTRDLPRSYKLPGGAKVSHVVVAGERLPFPGVGVLVARVANDGSTRQQRRAKDAR